MNKPTLFLTLLAVANSALAASFDCTKAKSFAEQTVCSDSDLSLADEALTRIYRAALGRVSDQDALLNGQRQWLAARNSCEKQVCVQTAYITRLKELTRIAFEKKGAGTYRCRSHGVEFAITDGVVTEFNAQVVTESSDLAVGYGSSCAQHIGLFYQTEGSPKYVLQFNADENQYGESLKCRVQIEDLGHTFRLRTSNCRSECMKFRFDIGKTAKACYRSP